MEASVTQQLFALKNQCSVREVSCEVELEELMQQIDLMVISKKSEWEEALRSLELRLEARDQELSRTRAAVERRDCEIGILSRKLEQAERSREEIIQSYEEQLEALKSQLSQLKKSYEKLHFHRVTRPESEQRLSPEQGGRRAELQGLTQKLEEYDAQARQWEKQRILYQKSLKALSDQKKSLTDRCDFFQKQSQSYEEKLSSSHSDLQSLRCQLSTWQERVRSEGLVIANLKSAIEEITASRDSAREENLQLLRDLRECQERCQRLEAELSEATTELQTRNDLLRAMELDQRGLDKEQNKNPPGTKLSGQDSHWDTSQRSESMEPAHRRGKPPHMEQDEVESCKKTGDPGLESVRADICDLTAKLNLQDVTVASLSEKLTRLQRGLHAWQPQNADSQESQCAKESRVREVCCLPPPEEEEPVKCLARGRGIGEEEPVQRTNSASHLSNACTDHCRSYNEETQRTVATALNHSTGINPALLDVPGPCGSGWETPSQSLLVDQSCLEAIFPFIKSDSCPPHLPEMDFSFILIGGQQHGPGEGEESFISAAERFLLEENRRAEDFEKILNSHIEELQRQSEHTLTRFTSFNHYVTAS